MNRKDGRKERGAMTRKRNEDDWNVHKRTENV